MIQYLMLVLNEVLNALEGQDLVENYYLMTLFYSMNGKLNVEKP